MINYSKIDNKVVLDVPQQPSIQVSNTNTLQTFAGKLKKVQFGLIAQKLHDLDVPSLSSAIAGFLHAETLMAKTGHLYTIASILTGKPPIGELLRFANTFSDMSQVFNLIMGKDTRILEDVIPEYTQEQSQQDQVIFSKIESEHDSGTVKLTVDPTKSANDNMEHIGMKMPMVAPFLEKHTNVIRLILGAISILACLTGFSAVLQCDDITAFVKSITGLSLLCRSGKEIFTTTSQLLDTVLPGIYSFFGASYVSPTMERLSSIMKDVESLYIRSRDMVNRCKVDYFGLQLLEVSELELLYADLEKRFNLLTTEERTLYNHHVRMGQIQAHLNALNDMIIDLYKTAGGKQRPTCLWLAGATNVGKTFLTEQICSQLAARHNSSVYARTWSDQFWSSYQGQTIVSMDDVLQHTEGKDIEEFHRYTSDDQKDVIGASLIEKGRPFVSKYLVMSSNFMWIAPPCKLKELLAINRRRDICVYVWNPAVDEYRSTHNGQYPDDETFFDAHPSRYFLYNPTYGYTLENSRQQHNLKFSPEAEWVIREVTVDEIIEGVYHLQQRRAETFRKRLVSIGKNFKYPLPKEPIFYDPTKFIHKGTTRPGANLTADPKAGSEGSVISTTSDLLGLPICESGVFTDGTGFHRLQLDIEELTGAKISLAGEFGSPHALCQAAMNKSHAYSLVNPGSITGAMILMVNGVYNSIVGKGIMTMKAIEDFVNKGGYEELKCPIINIEKATDLKDAVVMTYYEYYDITEEQGNPIRYKINHNVAPIVILYGPPGTGKTVTAVSAIRNLYKVTYEEGEVLPLDRPLLIDDIGDTPERVQFAKRIIKEYYDNQKYKFIVATLNDNAHAWQSATLHDRTSITRRSHFIYVGYSWKCTLMSTFYRLECAEYLKSVESREEHVTVSWNLYPSRDPAFYKLTPSLESIAQIIRLENNASASKVNVWQYDAFTMPMPLRPQLKVLLDDDHAPTYKGTSMLVLDEHGNYVKPSLANQARALWLFKMLREKFSNCKIADRTQAAIIVNSAQMKNDSSIKSAVLIAPTWAIGIETIEDKLIAYHIDEKIDSDYESWNGGFHFNGEDYFEEDTYDSAVHEMIERQLGIMRAMPEYDFKDFPKNLEALAAESPVHTLLTELAGLVDCLLTIGLSGAMLFKHKAANLVSAPTEPVETEERRVDVPQTPQAPGEDSASLKKRTPVADERQFEMPTTAIIYENQETEERKRNPKDKPNGNASDSDRGGGDAKTTKTVRYERKRNPKDKPNGNASDSDRGGGDAKKAPQTRFERKKNRDQLESRAPASLTFKKMAIIADGPEGMCEYGVAWGDKVTWAHETHLQSWAVFTKKIASIYNFRIVRQSNFSIDTAILNKLNGLSFKLDPRDTTDFSSALATYVVFGKAVDIEDSDKDCQELVTRLLKEQHVPKRFHDRTIAERASYGIEIQGGFDTQAKASASVIFKNMVKIISCDTPVMHGIMLCKRLGITNNHAPDGFKIRDMKTGKESQVQVLARARDNDIMLFEATDKSFPEKPDIRGHIPSIKELGPHLSSMGGEMAVLAMIPDGDIPTYIFTGGNTQSKCVATTQDKGRIEYRATIGSFGYTGVTDRGDCGSPVLICARQLNAKWIGIHARGADDISIAAPITREYIDDLMKREVTESIQVVHQSDDIEYDFTVPQQVCSKTNLRIVGKPKHKVFVPYTTTKYKTGLRLPKTHEPTIKSIFDPRNIDRRDMLEEGIGRYSVKRPLDFDPQEIADAAQQIGDYVAAMMVNKKMTTRLLTNTESINGAPNHEFPCAKSIDRQGSAGYPFVQKYPGRNSKQDYLYQNERNQLWYFREDQASQKVLAGVEKYIRLGKQGIAIDTPWIAYNKDECAKLKKIYDVSNQKTRVFFSGPMDFQLAYRRAFAAGIWRLTELHMEIPPRVGINPLSLEWTLLAYQHLKVNTNGFASDMENWDGTIPLQFLEALPKIYNIIYQATDPNWKPEDDLLRNAMHKPIQGVTVIVRDTVYKLDQAMASGYPGTAIDNSLINWMLFYCCWKRIMLRKDPPRSSFPEFMKHCKLSVYGDDNFCTVAQPLLAHFNFNSFKDEAIKFGFKVTDINKNGGVQPDFVDFSKIEFLKRIFLKEDFCYRPCLDKDSINKSLNWISGPPYEFKTEFRTMYEPEVFMQSLDALYTEIAMWGEEYFNSTVQMLRKASRGTKILIAPPLYADVVARTSM